jgi:hypothetical protein
LIQRRRADLFRQIRPHIVERAGGQLRALHFLLLAPLGQTVELLAGVGAAELHLLVGKRGGEVQVVHDHDLVRLAVLSKFEARENADFLHAAMDEVPVMLPLHTLRIRTQRRAQIEAELPLRLRAFGEHVGQDAIAGDFLPVAPVAAEFEEAKPRRKAQLVIREWSVAAKAPQMLHVAMDRQVASAGLLDPQRDWLSSERAELDLGAVRRYSVNSELEVAPKPRGTFDIHRYQPVLTERCIQFDQPFVLRVPRAQRFIQHFISHAATPFRRI